MPQQSRGYLRTRATARRQAPWLHDESARTHRPDVAGVKARHARRNRGRPMDRLSAAFPTVALSRWISLARRQVQVQTGLAERSVSQPIQERAGRRNAKVAGPLDVDRSRGFRTSVPACDVASPRISQLDLQRDAYILGTGDPADRDDSS